MLFHEPRLGCEQPGKVFPDSTAASWFIVWITPIHGKKLKIPRISKDDRLSEAPSSTPLLTIKKSFCTIYKRAKCCLERQGSIFAHTTFNESLTGQILLPWHAIRNCPPCIQSEGTQVQESCRCIFLQSLWMFCCFATFTSPCFRYFCFP